MRQQNDIKNVQISIRGLPVFSESEDDSFELMTDGEYSFADKHSTFSYVDSTLTGVEGMLTTFDVEPDRIVLKRDGGLAGDMIFDADQKHHFFYNTPFGSILMGIDTHSISSSMSEDGGKVEIRYDIEVDNVSISQNLFQIDIKSLPQ